MNQDLKQRLVGAVVITALASIFVPMLFNNPVYDDGKRISALKMPDAPAYDIDPTILPKSVEEIIALPKPLAVKGQSTVVASQQTPSNMKRWFIQVGSFGKESNAVSLKETIIKQGFPAIITSMTTDNELLYRVKVGPELDKKRAEVMKIKIDKLNRTNGILMLLDE